MKALINRLNFEVNSSFLIGLAIVYILVVNNQAFWSGLLGVIDASKVEYMAFFIAVFLLLFAVLFVLLSLFNFRYVLKPTLFMVVVASSFVSYFIDSFGTIIDVDMIQNVYETDTHEAVELLSAGMFFHVLVSGLIPAFILIQLKVKKYSFINDLRMRGIALVLVVVSASAATYLTFKEMSFVFRENRNLTFLINPVYPMLSVTRFYRTRARESIPLNMVFNDASRVVNVSSRTKKSVFVMVVGETARSANFHINGYTRNTTPLVEKENIISLQNVYSCGTATAISVPCIFSHLGHENYDDLVARNSENILDAFNRAGLNVLWRDNNSGCKGVCKRVPSENMHHLKIADYCSEDGCFDEVLLHDLQTYVDKLQDDAVIVLHQQGSHGPAYYKRYPDEFATFKPECNKASVQECSYNEIVNSYDNTILYTDYFLSKVIGFLKQNSGSYNTAMLYVSDHGESLGENGVYLHGMPYFLAPEEQIHVPLFIWLSEGFARQAQIDVSCLKQAQDERYSHDNIAHSLLGVMGVATRIYKSENDIFSNCRGNVRKYVSY